MPRLEFTASIDAPLQAVWEFHDAVETLPRITPPGTKVQIVSSPGAMAAGARFTLVIRQPPIFVPLRWETVITTYDPPRLFVDEQEAGPFAFWHHEHHFTALSDDETLVRDVVIYDPPFGLLGLIADRLFIRRQLIAMFAYRHRKTREALERATVIAAG